MTISITTWDLAPAASISAGTACIPAFSAGGGAPVDKYVWASSTPGAPTSSYAHQVLRPKPEQTRYSCGLIAQVDDMLILGLAPYLGGGHAVTAHAINYAIGPVNQYLWGGDIMFTSCTATEPFALAVRANCTSGFLHEDRGGGINIATDRHAQMRAILGARLLFPFGMAFSHNVEPFDKAHQHLDPMLTTLFGSKNVRHDIAHNVMLLNLQLESAAGVAHKDLTKSGHEILKKELPDPFLYQYMQNITESIERDMPWLAGIRQKLLPIEELGQLSGNEFADALDECRRVFAYIVNLFNKPPDEEPFGRYDIFVLERPEEIRGTLHGTQTMVGGRVSRLWRSFLKKFGRSV